MLLSLTLDRGGGIELSILSKHYGRQIDAYDIQTKRCDRYGEQDAYSERVMLIYDGLHYDSLAVAAFDGAPDDLDITILQVFPECILSVSVSVDLINHLIDMIFSSGWSYV